MGGLRSGHKPELRPLSSETRGGRNHLNREKSATDNDVLQSRLEQGDRRLSFRVTRPNDSVAVFNGVESKAWLTGAFLGSDGTKQNVALPAKKSFQIGIRPQLPPTAESHRRPVFLTRESRLAENCRPMDSWRLLQNRHSDVRGHTRPPRNLESLSVNPRNP